ncbi:MAG: SRPBCC family protein [Planctomycetes bacterium]|nr:SRPBCC family protein [Planctomycetota bacterium]
MLWLVVVLLGAFALFLAVVVGVVVLLGSRYPTHHTFARVLRVRKSPDEVWRVITDFGAQTAWNPLLRGAERLPDHEGREVWREISRQGPPMLLETTESRPPRRLVRTITDTKAAFRGRWEFELESAAPDGCRIQLTEHGDVPNPFFRFMVNVVGPAQYVEAYLRGLAKHFGEPAAALENVPPPPSAR